MTAIFYDSEIVSKAYTAKKLLDLSYLIQAQVASVYDEKGMVFPVVCSSTLLFLKLHGPASVTEVAKALEHPHQTVAQHLNTLGRLDIVEKRRDKTDQRRSEFVLTEIGEDQSERLERYNIEAADVFTGLDKDIGADLGQLLEVGRTHLLDRSMSDRFSELLARGTRS